MIYTNDKPLKLFSQFSGIGAFEKALSNLGINTEVVAFSEIDKHAIKNYCTLHNVSPDKNIGDISKADLTKIPEFDLLTYGFPCQDLSIAGDMLGFNGNRSSLLSYTLKTIKLHKPPYAIAENVKNLISKKFRKDFDKLLESLDKLGYNSYWKLTNASDYGVPQLRERVIIVSIRKDIDHNFSFKEPNYNKAKLLDYLIPEEQVEDKFYYPDEFAKPLIKKFIEAGKEGVYGVVLDHGELRIKNDVANCIDASYFKGADNHGQRTNIMVLGRAEFINGYESLKRVHSPYGLSPTLISGARSHEPKVQVKDRIRRLTPKECWKLMGFTDEDFNKVCSQTSNTQLYKQAGNSIVVPVLENILSSLFNNEDL